MILLVSRGTMACTTWRRDNLGSLLPWANPSFGALGDAVVSATFRKIGGPSGGGYGLIVRDQNTDSRNGTVQGGRFIVAELGDAGTIGIWRREDDHWVDLLPWTPSSVVHSGRVANELTVQTLGDDITLLANGTQVAQTSMGLPNGGVGVFVGGDGNQVVLERFTVRSGSAQVQRRPTPVPSTAAALPPVPTSTPAPAAAPASDVRPAINSYIAYMSPRFQHAGAALQAFSDASRQMAANPTLFFDADWRITTAAALVSMKLVGQEIQSYQPVPSELKHLDDLIVAIGKDLVFISDESVAGIDSLDSSRLDRAGQRMQAMTARVSEATAEMVAIKARYSI